MLLEKGVRMPHPDRVDIGPEIHADRISGNQVVLHGGTRLIGEKTLILDGAVIGYEQPVTIENCCVGPRVRLNGGFFRDAVFLKSAAMAAGAHVREGCILEEYAGAGHCAGIKQTILFPYVTLGSLINFCDCLMSGGTGRKHHSEVGSSYIHFNFTPQQDKATPSLIGDVPRGVMLDQPPVFLGGQGGLVGPARLGFGITIAAGTIYRKDELRSNRLIFESSDRPVNIAYTPGKYRNISRIMLNNLVYIGNLFALSQWYTHVRALFITSEFPDPMHQGLRQALELAIDERLKRLKEFMQKVKNTGSPIAVELDEKGPELIDVIEKYGQVPSHDSQMQETFLTAMQDAALESGKDYLAAIHSLESASRQAGTAWLQHIVEQLVQEAVSLMPSLSREHRGKIQ
jgi:bifunctional UDP-N-acetylglucosamine pyrophosphorylase / glucosamine-1-phosphate N-acetyltransferase